MAEEDIKCPVLSLFTLSPLKRVSEPGGRLEASKPWDPPVLTSSAVQGFVGGIAMPQHLA